MADFAKYITNLAAKNIGSSANMKLSDGTKFDGVTITKVSTRDGAITIDDNIHVNADHIVYAVVHEKEKD